MAIKQIIIRRGTATDWTASSKVLKDGEPAQVTLHTETGQKNGNKSSFWVFGNGSDTVLDLPRLYSFPKIQPILYNPDGSVKVDRTGMGRNLEDASRFNILEASPEALTPWEAIDKLFYPPQVPSGVLSLNASGYKEVGVSVSVIATLTPQRGTYAITLRKIEDLNTGDVLVNNTTTGETAVSNAIAHPVVYNGGGVVLSSDYFRRTLRGTIADSESNIVTFDKVLDFVYPIYFFKVTTDISADAVSSADRGAAIVAGGTKNVTRKVTLTWGSPSSLVSFDGTTFAGIAIPVTGSYKNSFSKIAQAADSYSADLKSTEAWKSNTLFDATINGIAYKFAITNEKLSANNSFRFSF